ncbi:MAG: hypothetical protein K8R59_16825 [Thermoanaerobaculales bacterium]|nr:hypothetical protein [Thermoanaerobaculales bacterium]
MKAGAGQDPPKSDSLQAAFHNRERIYMLPAGGTAMATLAGLLKAQGHHVEGVDTQLYPPMSTLLEELGIKVRLGWNPDLIPAVDRVIIGNAVPRTNPEVERVVADRRPYLSQAEAVAHYLLAEGREGLVVAGTHGKTTTASMLAWIFESAGADPTTLVGGLLRWSRRSFRLGHGPWMIIEGDEYNSAFFDRGPKFLHYRPRIFLLGPVEFDHGDLYPNFDAVLTAFRAGTAQVPRHGVVVANASSPGALAAVRDATAEILTVGASPDCALRLGETSVNAADGMTTTGLRWQDRDFELRLPIFGRHNAENASLAVAGAVAAGLEIEGVLDALARFPGVARRLDALGEVGGVLVVDDFAHHPTALAATVRATRERWPDRRLVIAYEPRSLTAARREFQEATVAALQDCDVALIAPPYHRGRLEAHELMDREAMAAALRKCGVLPIIPDEDTNPVEALLPALRSGDVVVGCSSGDFGAFHQRLLNSLAEGAHQ